ncbi:MAG: phospholipid carrier-dependent glycosyltransferase [Myxococcota bacterium]
MSFALSHPSARRFPRWLKQICRGPALTSSLLLIMILGGVILRVQHLGDPQLFTFDEELFVKNAHNYLLGLPDANDHPPLGKLALASGMLAFGYNTLGFRFASLCFGIQNLFLAYWVARCLFRNARAGWFAAAFLAADGFFIAYSRVALLDGLLTLLVLASVLAALTARSSLGVAVCALLVGLATSVKWSGAFAVFPVVAILWLERRVARAALLLFVLTPLVHAVLWLLALRITGKPHDVPALLGTMKQLFLHHVELGKRHNDLASPWYSWLWLYHPIVVKWWLHGATHHYASSAGNPVLWFPASVLAVFVPLAALLRWALPLERWLRRELALVIKAIPLRAELLSVLAWFALLSPWIVGRGKYTFMYHYLPSYAFALILLAGFMSRLERLQPQRVQVFASIALGMFIYFAPVWGEFAISEQAANLRLIFPSWRP